MSTDYTIGVTDATSRVDQLRIDRQELGLARVRVDAPAWHQLRDCFLAEAQRVDEEFLGHRDHCSQSGDAYSCGWAEQYAARVTTNAAFQIGSITTRRLLQIPLDEKHPWRIAPRQEDIPVMIDSGSDGSLFPPAIAHQIMATNRPVDSSQIAITFGGEAFRVRMAFGNMPRVWPGIILGTDVLNQAIWGVDWGQHLFLLGGTVFDVIGHDARWQAMPLSECRTDNANAPTRYAVTIQLFGRPVDLLLDSGAEFFAYVHQSCFPDTTFEVIKRPLMASADGERRIAEVTPAPFQVMDAPTLRGDPYGMIMVDDAPPAVTTPACIQCGMLGINFLQLMDFLVDPETAVLYYRKR